MTIALTDRRSRELEARAGSRLVATAAPEDDAPLYIDHASGAMVQDADGNQFIDYLCARGAAIAGHAHPDVVAAVTEQAALGVAFAAPAVGEIVLAEEICRRIAPVQMLRFVSSPAAAATAATEIAFATTGRDMLLTFTGADHGAFAEGWAQGHVSDKVVTVPWNDGEAVVAACAEHRFAAIVAEPYMTSIGLMPPVEGFLELLRNQADDNGALLTFDAVATALRVAAGGVQERTGVFADLTLLGPVIGGGLPLAAVGGRADLLAAADRRDPPRTYAPANPVAVAAGIATVALLDDAAYSRLETTTGQLATGLEAAARTADVPLVVHHVCGLLSVFFTAAAPRDHSGVAAQGDAVFADFRRAMLARGVYLPPSPRTPWFPSLAHSAGDVQQTVEAAVAALQEIAQR